MKQFQLVNECLGYQTAPEKTNIDPRYLVAGSQNVIVNRQRKVQSRQGFTRLGATNTALTPVRASITWHTSTGTELPIRFYDDELEVYLSTVDGRVLDAWYRIVDGLSTTEQLRFPKSTWWDTGENLDLLPFVIGDATLRRWNGAVAVAQSVTSNTITKRGNDTFARNRFFTTGSKNLINARTGTVYAYTGGESTTTLTGVTPNPTGEILANDVLIQQIVSSANQPAASRNNDTIEIFENQVLLGSNDDNEVFVSQNDTMTDYTFSSPRVAGEGATFTLDGPSRGIGSVGKTMILFAGENSIFKAEYEAITVSTTLAEILRVKKVQTGTKQGCLNADTIVQAGGGLIYLSNEPTLRFIQDPDRLEAFDQRTLSNPIKPDFDDEDFTNAQAIWHRNAYYLSTPVNSHTYILEFVEDADGNIRRFWQPPQILPARSFFIYLGNLYCGSNQIAETYRLFDGNSDLAGTEKTPISCIAKFAYRNFNDRTNLKTFDEYFVEGEISPQTNDLLLSLNYDFGGFTQLIQKTINGTDKDILEETLLNASLGQIPLGQNPLGGALSAPDDAAKFRVIFEIAKEDFHEIQAVFSTNELDRFWSILSHGPNAKLSTKQNTIIKK